MPFLGKSFSAQAPHFRSILTSLSPPLSLGADETVPLKLALTLNISVLRHILRRWLTCLYRDVPHVNYTCGDMWAVWDHHRPWHLVVHPDFLDWKRCNFFVDDLSLLEHYSSSRALETVGF